MGIERLRQGGIGLLVFVVMLTSTAVVVRADQPLDEYNLAVQLYRQNRWGLATESFRKFLKDYPTHEKASLARLYLGLTLVNQSEFTAAREELRNFVKEAPQNQNIPQARYRIAECSYLLNDLPAARIELQTYLKEHPTDALGERAWPYLGDVHLRLNDPAAAEAAFAEAVRRYPEGVLIDDAQFGWAKSLEALRKYDEALAKYRPLADGKGARAADALFQIGSREFDAGSYAAAAKTYQALVERFPQSGLVTDARLNAGFALFRQNDFVGAEALFAQVAQEPTRALSAGYWQALARKSQGQYASAVELLTKLSEVGAKDALGEAIAFQRGMCERLNGQTDLAQVSLMGVVEEFPQGEYADDALHFATELALEAGQLPVARERLDRFARDFPQSGLRLYQQLLAGRYQLALAAEVVADPTQSEQLAEYYEAATAQFEAVLKASTLPRTRGQARYYLALTRQLQGNHAAALEVLKPLVDEVLAGAEAGEFAEALVMQADSWLRTGKYAEAAAATDTYLTRFPQGRQRSRALSLRALALMEARQTPEALAVFDQLAQEFAQSPTPVTTALQLAEVADRHADWPTSATLYTRVKDLGRGTENEPLGLRGLAWAEYQQRQFAESARDFADLATRFPEHRFAAEASYYHAESLQEQGDLAGAAKAFAAAFLKLAPTEPAPAGAEQEPPLVFAYRAGLQGARAERELKNVEPADALYAAVLDKFPRPQQLDRVLDEWALLNYDAERFEKADEIFRRLIRDVPESDLADNAQLSLAESDLISGKLTEARQSFEELVKNPKSDEIVRERAHFQLIVLALEERRWADVLKLSAEFQAAFPDSSSFGYARYAAAEATLADAKVPADQLEKLLAELGEMTKVLPAGSPPWAPRIWILAAEAQFRLKRYAEIPLTLADLKQQLPGNPLTYQAEEILGRALKQEARFPEAREALERVLADERAFRTETAAKSQFLIAETWFLQEKWKEAFLAYQKVYASYAFPDWQSAALLQSGKCDEQLGNLKEAIATYDRLISEFPNSPHIEDARQRLMQAKLKSGSAR